MKVMKGIVTVSCVVFRQVSVYAEDHLLDALCLQHLLSQLAGDNLSLYFSDYTDQTLDGESTHLTRNCSRITRDVTHHAIH